MADPSDQQRLESADRHRQAGRYDDALAICRQVIAEHPENAGAHHLAGIAEFQSGAFESAIESFRLAVALRPDQAHFHGNLGLALAAAGQTQQAVNAYRRALSIWPEYAGAYNNLGMALSALRKPDEAIAAYRRAMILSPDSAETMNNLANALGEKAQWPEALELFGKALRLRPDYAEAYNNLGFALQANDRQEEAVSAFESALRLNPKMPITCCNLGNALKKLGRLEAARDAYRKGIELDPTFPEPWMGLGDCFMYLDQLDDALAAFRRVIAARPDFVDARLGVANTLHLQGDFEQNLARLREILDADPKLPVAHWDLANTLLLQGDFKQGWSEYEWRLKVPEFRQTLPKISLPRWDAGPLHGRRILLHSEQGLGDTLHFARYISAVAACGGKVTVHCQPLLKRLIMQMPVVADFFPTDERPGEFDVHCPLPSLPLTLGRVDPLWNGPYLKSDPSLAEKFKDVVSQSGDRLKVGLVWGGRPRPVGRSIPLAQLKPLAMDGVQLFSLQVGDGREQIQKVDFKLIDAADRIADFADTAALMQSMDLIVTIDTAAAQLAGAMGLRVFILLKKVPDWRWLLDRSDSPWYPTARLFRQSKPRDWSAPIEQVRQAVAEMADQRGRP